MKRYFELTYKKDGKTIFYFDMCSESNSITAAIMPFMEYMSDYDLRHYGIFERKKADWEYFKNHLALVVDGYNCYWVNNFITEQPEFVAKYTVNDKQNRLASVYNKTNEELELRFSDTGDIITLLPHQRKYIENGTRGEQIVKQIISGNYIKAVA